MLGQILGWVLTVSAAIIAYGETVMAFRINTYKELSCGELWTLLTGRTFPDFNIGLKTMFHLSSETITSLPAWVLIGFIGLSVLILPRVRFRKNGRSHTTHQIYNRSERIFRL